MAIDKKNAFVGFHTRFGNHEAVDGLIKLIHEGLAPMGFNALILELNPGYSYRCFPEYSNGTVTYEDLQFIKETCDEQNIKVIPLFQCLSHQCENFGDGKPWPLLVAHPEFIEQKDFIEGGEWPDIYCHSWCASNDDIYQYIFPMMDEIIEALDADVVHIGLDEVFEIGEDSCPLCKGKNKAELFARTVRILHNHLSQKGIETMMWGDRLLNAEKLGMNMWEADKFGMYPAFDMEDKVTRDIVITDWHYDLHSHGYPSVEQFMKAGFHTIASFGANDEQAAHFWKHCLEYIYLGKKNHWPGKLGGLLITHWTPLTNKLADEILGGMNGTIGKSDNPWDSSEVGRCIQAIVPKGKYFRK
ncbi:family 20 glycosylhydrolase [Paludicola sp. MB14-C6]|uniref:family 20 glycosylhydrolase n=1 Tax=Paludihabitans sp. MB14-C6 TaxID=3070656 RepID=UPI0027DCA5F1|nr:family 20 glycosylhydrolase [Paludicola sp. MB14-C6]WMJ21801.1 family 20 glycosylhydrolase [Paludicola sp. MB14-C6]